MREYLGSGESSANVEERLFASAIDDVVTRLNTTKIDWRIVGGLATEALVGKPSYIRRTNGTTRDIDIMTLNHIPEALPPLKQHFREEEQKNKTYPEVSFVSTIKTECYLADRTRGFRIPQVVPHLVRENGEFSLQFREVKVPIDPLVLSAFQTEIRIGQEHIPIQTFPPQTILHLYLQRIGYIKPKDLVKVKDFARGIRKMDYEKLPHELYIPFHDFARKIRSKYKITTSAQRAYTCIDHQLFNSRLSDKLIPRDISDALLTA